MKMMKTLDLCGEQCPYPVIKTKKAVKALADGDTLEILTDYLCSRESIVAFIRSEGLGLSVEQIDASKWKIVVRGKGSGSSEHDQSLTQGRPACHKQQLH